MDIKRISGKHIDKVAWDNCIVRAENRRIYAMSWYLDVVCDGNWDALVYGNYQAVMPLPYKMKAGVKFYIQPVFCQQLGVFWQDKIPQKLMLKFIKAIPHSFYQICFTGKSSYYFSVLSPVYRPNYVIKLECEYLSMLNIMSTNHRRNIKKASRNSLLYREVEVGKYIDFKKESGTQLTEKSWRILDALIRLAVRKGVMKINGAYINETLVSVVCWLEDFDRLVYLQAASNLEGKRSAAAFGLVDNVLREKAFCGRLIDFEGSVNPGVARFYRGFGAQNEAYPVLTGKGMNLVSKLFNK